MAVIQLGRIEHVASNLAYAQVAERYGVSEIDDAVAASFASWWQSPGSVGRHLAALASGAPVEYGDLAQDIYLTHNDHSPTLRDRRALDALSTWALDRTNANRQDYPRQRREVVFTDTERNVTTIIREEIVTWDELQAEAREHDDR